MPCPSQTGQRPGPVLKLKRPAWKPRALRLQGLGEQLADGVPEADVGGRAAARRLADRRLVDLEHALDGLEAADAGAAHPAPRRLAGRHRDRQVVEQHFASQRALARTRYAGDGHQARQRQAGVELLQVVQLRAPARRSTRLGQRSAGAARRVLHGLGQAGAGAGVGGRHQVGHGAFGHHLAAAPSGAGADVDQVLGTADGVLVVLDHHQGVAACAQQLGRASSRMRLSRGCRPMVGSSST
jgi:hypothetical protein